MTPTPEGELLKHQVWNAVRLSAVLLAPLGAMSAQERATPERAGRVQGTVVDKIAGRPLVQATVLLVRADDPARSRSVTTDAGGHFRFDEVVGAQYVVQAMHPRLDTLAIEALSRPVAVRAGQTSKVTLETSTAMALRARVCGAAGKQDVLSAFVHGQLRDVNTARSFGAGTVRVEWNDVVVTAAGVQQTTQHVDAATNETGGFILCGVPVGGIIRLSAHRDADSTGVVEVQIPMNGIARQDLSLGSTRSGQVALTVRGLSGTGVPNAKVSVWGTQVEATTDSAGRVMLSNLPSGTYTVSALAIGYEPTRTAIDIATEGTTTATVRMPSLQLLSAYDIRAARSQGYAESMRDKTFGAFDPRFGVTGVFNRMVPMISMTPVPFERDRMLASSCTGGGRYTTGASIARLASPARPTDWTMVGGTISTNDLWQSSLSLSPADYTPPSECFMTPLLSEQNPRRP